jgi:type IV pilus assembly protein PilW
MNRYRTQLGLTLIEVMVGVTLSLILLIAMTSILLKNRDTYRSQTTLQRYQEDVRMSSIMLGNVIRNAGAYGALLVKVGANFQNASGTTLTVEQVSDIAGEMVIAEGIMFDGMPIISSPAANDGTAASLPHSLTVRYKSRGTLLDCLGGTVGTMANACVAANTFAVAGNALTCSVRTTCSGVVVDKAAQPLVDNIESMAIRYGVDTNLDGSVDQYVWPSEVGVANWGTVASVQVSLSASSAQDVNPVARQHTYFSKIGIEGGAGVTSPLPGDKRAWREYNIIVPINRRLHSDG